MQVPSHYAGNVRTVVGVVKTKMTGRRAFFSRVILGAAFGILSCPCQQAVAADGYTGSDQILGYPTPSNSPSFNQNSCGLALCPPLALNKSKLDEIRQTNMRKSNLPPTTYNVSGQFYNLKPSGPNLQEEQKDNNPVGNHQVPGWCSGYIRPDGQFSWTNYPKMGQSISGKVPNSPLSSIGETNAGLVASSAVNSPVFEHLLQHTTGLPVHAHSAAITVALDTVYQNSLATSPRSSEMQTRQNQLTRTAQSADNQGAALRDNSQTAYGCMSEYLFNVANENATSCVSAREPYKPLSGAIWMIQQMYKHVFTPMALLLLLPGSILTQVKGMVEYGITGGSSDDTVSPVIGLVRTVMAIFLIPATQLVVSYSIDTGNSLMEAVSSELHKNNRLEHVSGWMREQAFTSDPRNMDNSIKRVYDEGKAVEKGGKLGNGRSDAAVQEQLNGVGAAIQNTFNSLNNGMSQALLVLNAFQIVVICYLFLLGPVAAALYAWPGGIGKDLFKKAFSSWLDGVVVLCLWKFWWCILLLCMALRLESYEIQANSQYEMYYFTAFMALLVFVPFNPFEFRPGEIVTQLLEKAQQGGGGGGGGGGKGQSGSKSGKQGAGNNSSNGQGRSGSSGGGSGGGDGTNPDAGGEPGGSENDDNDSSSGLTPMGAGSASPVDGRHAPQVAPPPSSIRRPKARLAKLVVVLLISFWSCCNSTSAAPQQGDYPRWEKEAYCKAQGCFDPLILDPARDKKGRLIEGPPVICPSPIWPVTGPATATKKLTDIERWAVNEMLDEAGIKGAAAQNPLSASQFARIMAVGTVLQDKLSKMPENSMHLTREQQNVQTQQSADTAAAAARQQSACAIDFCRSGLTNFTVDGGNKWNTVRNQLFVPIAILLLLPGAIATQVKATVAQGFSIFGQVNPLEGLQRSIVAAFLIPASLLVVNYGIDLSNSLAFTIQSEYARIFSSDMYEDAMAAEIRALPLRDMQSEKNNIPQKTADMDKPVGKPPETAMGKWENRNTLIREQDPRAGLDNTPEDRSREQVPYVVNTQRAAFNGTNSALATTWNILCAFQQAYLYYLWFVGPIMAALWVWPMKQLRDAFPNWCEGVVTLCFWSLFWHTAILVMACFRGVEGGTILMTALNFLATASVKFAFDFAGLVKAAGQEAGKAAEKAMQGGGGKSGGGGGGGAGAASGSGGAGKTDASRGGGTAEQKSGTETVSGGGESNLTAAFTASPSVALNPGAWRSPNASDNESRDLTEISKTLLLSSGTGATASMDRLIDQNKTLITTPPPGLTNPLDSLFAQAGAAPLHGALQSSEPGLTQLRDSAATTALSAAGTTQSIEQEQSSTAITTFLAKMASLTESYESFSTSRLSASGQSMPFTSLQADIRQDLGGPMVSGLQQKQGTDAFSPRLQPLNANPLLNAASPAGFVLVEGMLIPESVANLELPLPDDTDGFLMPTAQVFPYSQLSQVDAVSLVSPLTTLPPSAVLTGSTGRSGANPTVFRQPQPAALMRASIEDPGTFQLPDSGYGIVPTFAQPLPKKTYARASAQDDTIIEREPQSFKVGPIASADQGAPVPLAAQPLEVRRKPVLPVESVWESI